MSSRGSHTDRSGPAEPPYDRYGVVGIVVREGRLLVIRRSRHVVAPRLLCFPGGGIEAGESEGDALRREFQEEIAAEVRPLARIWENVTPWNVHLAWWTAALAESCVLVPNAAEVETVHWMTIDQMLAAPDLLRSNIPFLRAVAEGRIRIPGIGPLDDSSPADGD